MEVQLRHRDPESGEAFFRTASFDPKKTLVVVVDAWEYHWCTTWCGLAGGRVPRLNEALKAARRLGMTVIHAPTDSANAFAGTPQRERFCGIPRMTPPASEAPQPPGFPGGETGERCMCHTGMGCLVNYGERSVDARLEIAPEDLISADGVELYTWVKSHDYTHVIHTGFATNICLAGKPEGIIPMTRAGLTCIVARDLTEAFYANTGAESVDRLTEGAVQHLEKHVAPSIDLVAELRKAGAWDDDAIVDLVRIVPWGQPNRPQFFDDSLEVSMTFPMWPGAIVRYTLDGSEPSGSSPLYEKPLQIAETAVLRAAAFVDGRRVSLPTECHYAKRAGEPSLPDVHLADLEPSQITMVDWGSWSSVERGSFPPPQKDVSYAGTPLRIRGQAYERGMGLRAPSQLVYEIRPEWNKFVGLVGMDDAILAKELGRGIASFPSAVFRVFIDGCLVAESPVMRISQPPWPFEVDISEGARVISLAATDAGDGDREDVIDWVQAGFVTGR